MKPGEKIKEVNAMKKSNKILAVILVLMMLLIPAGSFAAQDEQTKEVSVIFSNDDYGIEIDEFDTDEFLELFCKAAKPLEVEGRLFDVDDEEYEFTSAAGDSYYLNAKRAIKFNDDLDEEDEDGYED